MQTTDKKNDFSKGSVIGNIMSLAVPITAAQLINVLYNIVDRIYIGRIPEHATLSMTGLGLCLPIISIVTAFANLIGTGGAPLCSIERGRGNDEEAEMIMGNSFSMMIITGVILTVLGLLAKRPMLYLFGASDQTFPYANSYVSIYLLGSIFVMVGLGMNSFINSQGFGRIGMMTVLLGAIANIILDPVFIFVLNMGVQGAALATIISQGLSAFWIIRFLTGPNTILKLKLTSMKLEKKRVRDITALGLSGFTMSITNSLVQIVCNSTLQTFGNDLYVGVMTVVSSVREIISMPVQGIRYSAQPVMSYNYGAEEYKRVKQAIAFVTISTVAYLGVMWLLIHSFPEFFIRVFNQDAELVEAAVPSMRIYYFGYCFMSLQFAGQTVFTSLGKAKKAIFFSIFRKAVIVTPLTLLLPRMFGLGVTGVFLAEPISNVIGGLACFVTMLVTVLPELKEQRTTYAG